MAQIELPAPKAPVLTRMLSHGNNTWMAGGNHPMDPTMRIVRMFIVPEGVEVYSVTADGKGAVRNLVPILHVTLTEEAMPISMLVEELDAAENEDDEEEEEEDEEEDEVVPDAPTDPAPASISPNGQGAAS